MVLLEFCSSFHCNDQKTRELGPMFEECSLPVWEGAEKEQEPNTHAGYSSVLVAAKCAQVPGLIPSSAGKN